MDLGTLENLCKINTELARCEKLLFLNIRGGDFERTIKHLLTQRIGLVEEIKKLDREVVSKYISRLDKHLFTAIRSSDHDCAINLIHMRGVLINNFTHRHGWL